MIKCTDPRLIGTSDRSTSWECVATGVSMTDIDCMRPETPHPADQGLHVPFLPARLRWRCPRVGVTALVLTLMVGVLGCRAIGLATPAGTLPNIPVVTAGGNQLWADLAWDDGWRVQRHVWTGHARLLDDGDVRRAWGGEEACMECLVDRRVRGDALPIRRKTVVLLHGLWRTRDSMDVWKTTFEDAGYDAIDIAYPSARDGVEDHAAQVAGLLNRLSGEGREISFVTHSLGALVVRALFAREGDPWRERHTAHRAVFVAAPNGGAELARVGLRIPGVRAIYGEPMGELAHGIADELPVPPIPFATVSAGRGDGEGWNPLIEGDDDGVVSVAETHLEGEASALFVEGFHSFVMRDLEVARTALDFIDVRSSVMITR